MEAKSNTPRFEIDLNEPADRRGENVTDGLEVQESEVMKCVLCGGRGIGEKNDPQFKCPDCKVALGEPVTSSGHIGHSRGMGVLLVKDNVPLQCVLCEKKGLGEKGTEAFKCPECVRNINLSGAGGSSVPAGGGSSVPAGGGSSIPAGGGSSIPEQGGSSIPPPGSYTVPVWVGDFLLPPPGFAALPPRGFSAIPARGGSSIPEQGGSSISALDKGKRKLSECDIVDRPKPHEERPGTFMADARRGPMAPIQPRLHIEQSIVVHATANGNSPSNALALSGERVLPTDSAKNNCFAGTANEYHLKILRENITKLGGVLSDEWHVDMMLHPETTKTYPMYHSPEGRKFRTIIGVASYLGLQPCPGIRDGNNVDGELANREKRKAQPSLYMRRINRQKLQLQQASHSGELLPSLLPVRLTGATRQATEFLNNFSELLGIVGSYSLIDLERELLNPWVDQFHPLVETLSGTPEISGPNQSRRIRPTGLILARIQGSMLKLLAGKLKCRVSHNVDRDIDSEASTSRSGRKSDRDIVQMNELTWPEIARRYVLGTIYDEFNISSSELCFNCLSGDGSLFCEETKGYPDLFADAMIFAEAMEKISNSLKTGAGVAVECEIAAAIRSSLANEMNEEDMPEWARALKSVRYMPTNNGSPVRYCVLEALSKDPPEWARVLLEYSISKEVYKHNSAGKSKKEVMLVLELLKHKPAVKELEKKRRRKAIKTVDGLVTNHCQRVLKRTIAADKNRDLCNLLGRTNVEVMQGGVLGYPGMVSRPSDFRSIYLRLNAGAYDGYHEAFFDDVQEVFQNIRIAHRDDPDLMKVYDELLKTFEEEYNSQVLPIVSKIVELTEQNFSKEEILKGGDDESESLVPWTPWEEGICKVCGLDTDADNVMLCDASECDSEYHIYCLDPPLLKIPEEKWFCPACVSGGSEHQSPSSGPHHEGLCQQKRYLGIYLCYKKKLIELANAMKIKEFWELTTAERVFLLNFLRDEALKSTAFLEHMEKRKSPSAAPKLTIQIASREQLNVDPVEGNCSNNDPVHKTVGVNPTDLQIPGNMFSATENQIVVGETSKQVDSIEIQTSNVQCNKDSNSFVGNNMDLDREFPVTRALAYLKKTVGSCSAPMTRKAEKYPVLRVKEGIIYRCECLEPLWPSRKHCFTCHQSFFMNKEPLHHSCKLWKPIPGCNGANSGSTTLNNLEGQRTSRTNLSITDVIDLGYSSARSKHFADENSIVRRSFVHKMAERPLAGKGLEILRCLKISLLDMDAALDEAALRTSRSSPNRRRAWRSITKYAGSIYEMVQATIILEDMIKSDYLKSDWWYWSSPSAAAKISTLSGLALRIFALDSAILYQKSVMADDPAATQAGIGSQDDPIIIN